MLLASNPTTTEGIHVPLLPPKREPLINAGWKAPRELLEKLDWIAAREEGYSRNELMIVALEKFVAAYEEEKGIKVQRLPTEEKARARRKK